MQKPEENYIETVSGIRFQFLEPTWEMFKIKDIAHALSMNCRYTGHCSRFYSVAEHSVHVSNLLNGTGLELAGLLHDASEAYIADISSPVKNCLPDYKKIEDNISATLFAKYGLEYPVHPAVKHCDLVMLSTEAHHLIPSRGDTWDMWLYRKRPPVAAGIKPSCVDPQVAKTLFLERYYELQPATNHN
jgi:hypothetical protein